MNKVVHFELPADDLGRAQKFYSEVFGWEISKVPDMEYHMIKTVETDEKQMPKTVGAINGGLMKKQSPTETPVIVIDVDNLDEHLIKAQSAGAKIVLSKMTVGDMGYYARISDTEGNVVGVWQDIK